MSTVASSPPAAAPAVPTLPIYRLSVAQYHAMVEHGILTTEDRVELIHGWLVAKMTKHPPHTISTGLVQDGLTGVLPPGWHLRIQDPITLTDSAPEPDAVVARGDRRDYSSRHPRQTEVALVVEVSDSTLDTDRGVKKALYASERIPTYWIVNLIDGQLEVYTDPTGPAAQPDYLTFQALGETDEIAVVLDGQEVGRLAVRDLLP